ncbi:MAG: glycerate kinase [Acidimicrobiales bacterium]
MRHHNRHALDAPGPSPASVGGSRVGGEVAAGGPRMDGGGATDGTRMDGGGVKPDPGGNTVVAAPDKFRGTATAAEVAQAVAEACVDSGWQCDRAPVADGGEGTLEALGSSPAGSGQHWAVRHTTVDGPLGDPVRAEWRVSGATAVVEMARASGLELVGGPERNDALAAATAGTGELILAALDSGARRVIVGAGGSATTDGGFGALGVLAPRRRFRPGEVVVACDVDLGFLDAARVFAGQKGASPAQVRLLERRLERLWQLYLRDYGVDVRHLPGSGAAGGLAGGLAALGAELVAGFEVVAEAIDLAERIAGADLVVTGEGTLDAESFQGKAVGGVLGLAAEAGVDALVVVGEVDPYDFPDLGASAAQDGFASQGTTGAPGAAAGTRRLADLGQVGGLGDLADLGHDVTVVSLVERFGLEVATGQTNFCVRQVVAEALASRQR